MSSYWLSKILCLLNCYASCNKIMADLKDEILSKIDQKFNKLKLEFLSELKDQIKKEVSEAIKTETKKREEQESTVSPAAGACEELSEASEWFGMYK